MTKILPAIRLLLSVMNAVVLSVTGNRVAIVPHNVTGNLPQGEK